MILNAPPCVAVNQGLLPLITTQNIKASLHIEVFHPGTAAARWLSCGGLVVECGIHKVRKGTCL